jgi:hypothetical protein
MKALTVVVLLIGSGVAFATDVTVCGQKIMDGDTGVLQADLDCSAASGLLAAVLVGNGTTLSLNGHTIIASPDADGVAGDVARRFAVVGPGAITGGLTGIAGGLKTRVTIRDVDLSDNQFGIDVSLGTLDLTNVTVASNRSGVSARTIRAQTLTVTTNGNGDCILGGTIRGTDVTVTGCFTGIGVLRSVRLQGLTATGNLTIGVVAARVRLIDSVVTGNIFIGQPLDILSKRRPVLLGTSCGVSRQKLADGSVGATWGVCADD